MNGYTPGPVDRAATVRKNLHTGRPAPHQASKHAQGSGRAAKKRRLHPSPARRFQARQIKQSRTRPMTDAEWEQYVLDSPAVVPDVESPTPLDRQSPASSGYRTFRLVAGLVLFGLLLVFAAVEYANRLREGREQITRDGCLLLAVAGLLVVCFVAWWFAWRHGSD